MNTKSVITRMHSATAMSVSDIGFAIMLSSLYTAQLGQEFYPAVCDF